MLPGKREVTTSYFITQLKYLNLVCVFCDDIICVEGIQLIQGQVISKDGHCSSSYIINTLEKVLLDPIFISTAAANKCVTHFGSYSKKI